MTHLQVEINRAPVLCLWATVVARRLGYTKDEALSLAKGVTGLTAQSKGQRLGLFSKPTEARKARGDEEFYVELLGRHVPTMNTEAGLRSLNKGKEVSAESVNKQRHIYIKRDHETRQTEGRDMS